VNPTYDPINLGAYDRLFHTHGEEQEQRMVTFGSMMVAGNEAVQASTSDIKKYYWEIYHLMGDPSVMTYLTKPSPMQVSLSNYLDSVANVLTARVAPFAYCALTDIEGELLCAGFADAEGNITLPYNALSQEKYRFSAWAQHYIQYFKTLTVGIQEINPISCTVYPNPTTGELRITNYELRITSIDVFDVYGRKLLEQKAEGRKQKENSPPVIPNEVRNLNNNDRVVLDISHFPAGIYFLKIDTDKGEIMKKIMKY
jgi:hypothetical protein